MLSHIIDRPNLLLARTLDKGDLESIKTFAANVNVEGEPFLNFNDVGHFQYGVFFPTQGEMFAHELGKSLCLDNRPG